MVNRDAVIKTQWANRQVQTNAQAPVIIKIIQAETVGSESDIADVIERGESNADAPAILFLLRKHRHAILDRTEPVCIPANRFLDARFARTNAAVLKAAQGVQAAQI